jgi:perosamine synthetase
MKIANKYGLAVIEDATESLGSYYIKGKYKGCFTGVVGDFGCLSFNGNKIITSGGGGMILVKNEETADKARYLTTQAKDDEVRYIHDQIGFNYRLTNIQAAVGVAQLEKLKGFIAVKRRNFKIYNEAVRSIKGLRLIEEPSYGRSNYWFYSLVVEADRYGISGEQLRHELAGSGIHTRPLWHLNHLQRPYRNNQAYKIERAVNYSRQVLNLPCSVNLSSRDIHKVIKVLEKNAGK